VTDACYRDVWNVVNNAKKILQELLPFYTLGVVSNFYGNLDVVCREFGLEKIFHAMIDSAVVGIRKPDPGIFSLALRQLGASPHESFVLGDSYERDVVPSKKLGCSTIWLYGKSWNVPSNTEAADFTIHRFEEVKMIVLG
jgi:putative hydrolase of the HAD superfamily